MLFVIKAGMRIRFWPKTGTLAKNRNRGPVPQTKGYTPLLAPLIPQKTTVSRKSINQLRTLCIQEIRFQCKNPLQICSCSDLFLFRFVPVPICSCSDLFLFRFVPVQICSCSDLFLFRFVPIPICSCSDLLQIYRTK